MRPLHMLLTILRYTWEDLTRMRQGLCCICLRPVPAGRLCTDCTDVL
jgi:hypothetical protein